MSRHRIDPEFCSRLERAIRPDSCRDVAQKLGTSPETIRRYLRGLSTPSASLLASLCRAYGVNANWLLIGEPPIRGTSWREMVRTSLRDPHIANAVIRAIAHLESRADDEQQHAGLSPRFWQNLQRELESHGSPDANGAMSERPEEGRVAGGIGA